MTRALPGFHSHVVIPPSRSIPSQTECSKTSSAVETAHQLHPSTKPGDHLARVCTHQTRDVFGTHHGTLPSSSGAVRVPGPRPSIKPGTFSEPIMGHFRAALVPSVSRGRVHPSNPGRFRNPSWDTSEQLWCRPCPGAATVPIKPGHIRNPSWDTSEQLWCRPCPGAATVPIKPGHIRTHHGTLPGNSEAVRVPDTCAMANSVAALVSGTVRHRTRDVSRQPRAMKFGPSRTKIARPVQMSSI